MKLRSGISVVILAVMLALPANIWACACCANPGHYHSGSIEVRDHVLSEMERLRVGRTANLFVTEAGLDEDSRGITQPKLTYSVSGSLTNNKWTLSFSSGRNTGKLIFELPAKMWTHSADIHDRKISAGGGPLLYKEWRLEGEIRGSGIFKAGFPAPAKYRLILQGRGNACDNAEDFTNWRLEVRGESADYALYGKLLKPIPGAVREK